MKIRTPVVNSNGTYDLDPNCSIKFIMGKSLIKKRKNKLS